MRGRSPSVKPSNRGHLAPLTASRTDLTTSEIYRERSFLKIIFLMFFFPTLFLIVLEKPLDEIAD